MRPLDIVLLFLAAVLAGAVNALAGGGTLITFPALLAVGVPAIAANVTNTVALTPGYLSATLAQARDLGGQRSRLWTLLPVGAAGGVLGGVLLLQTGERVFAGLVPWLILLAAGLLGVQKPVRAWVQRRVATATVPSGTRTSATAVGRRRREALVLIPVGVAAIYGGYFGAGLSVILLAALGLVIEDTLTRLNALKQGVAFAVNTAAAVLFAFSGQTRWGLAGVMAVGAVLGGALGGRLASRVPPNGLRWTVVAIGTAVGVYYLVG